MIKYIQENKSDEAVIQLLKELEKIPDIKNQFEYYYMGKINEFFSLKQEHIYLIINSYQYVKKNKFKVLWIYFKL